MTVRVPAVLTIAGSDSGGGAGIQADLKTFAALGVYGASAITAITAQNTQRVARVHHLPPDLVAAQIDAVASDIGIDAAKTGMLGTAAVIEVVAAKVDEYKLRPLVVDPVMVAESGDRLLEPDAIDTMRERLLPLATVLTPNVPEAEALLGRSLESWDDIREGAKEIVALGTGAVVITGGHAFSGADGNTATAARRERLAVDLLYDGTVFHEFTASRVDTTSTHGTGCTFASAIAAGLAKGSDLHGAVAMAKAYVTKAMQAAYPVGQGHGPVHHFYRYWQARAYEKAEQTR
ncbi:MAG: bifunctional hydroxymethylpyrimidine kinase/phosphomethylpyrimidine kinase [Chloroflexi bacterium]|nr:bifunctional hydroxymethylpyrimidine kinase/phosphomethylpyrimidine kinase [Chloroflexota bacterium]